MAIEAKVIQDSLSPSNKRITTFVLRYPRFIHSELMTHRVFSRNAASSRAIPIEKMIDQAVKDPAMPVKWGSRKKGMQSGPELIGGDLTMAMEGWLTARDAAVERATILKDINLSKEICNRILEPWMHMTSIVTATEWDNFYHLRCHPAAQPEMKALADAILKAHNESRPIKRDLGQWHLPFVLDSDYEWAFENMTHKNTAKPCGYALGHGADPNKIFEFPGPAGHDRFFQKLSVARCARVSYLNHDGTAPNIQKDLELHDRLLHDGHVSPFEHQATPLEQKWDYEHHEWEERRSANFIGWRQYRTTLPNEHRENYPGLLRSWEKADNES